MSDRKQINSTRTLFSLAEAADAANQSIEYLLRLGRDEDLPLLVRVPERSKVFRFKEYLLHWNDATHEQLLRRSRDAYAMEIGVRPREVSKVEYLEIALGEIRLMIATGEAEQSLFERGFRVDGDGAVDVVELPELPKAVDETDNDAKWLGCFKEGSEPHILGMPTGAVPIKIRLVPDLIRVRRVDLERLKLVEWSLPSRFDFGFRVEPFMPASLVQLGIAAEDLWGRNQESWKKPEGKQVVDRLKRVAGFPTRIATAAAQILRASFMDWDQDAFDEAANSPESSGMAWKPRTLFDWTVKTARLWEGIELTNTTSILKEDEVVSNLMLDASIELHVAEAIWWIALPDELKGRKKRGPRAK